MKEQPEAFAENVPKREELSVTPADDLENNLRVETARERHYKFSPDVEFELADVLSVPSWKEYWWGDEAKKTSGLLKDDARKQWADLKVRSFELRRGKVMQQLSKRLADIDMMIDYEEGERENRATVKYDERRGTV